MSDGHGISLQEVDGKRRRSRAPRYRSWVFTSYEDPRYAGAACRTSGEKCSTALGTPQPVPEWPVCSCESPQPWPDGGWSYICFGRERCPTTNRLHWQGYFEFAKPLTLSTIRRKCAVTVGTSFTLEPRRGTQDQAIAYCAKDGVFSEWGERAKSGGMAGFRSDLSAIRDRLLEGTSLKDLSVSDFPVFLQYRRSLQAFKDLHVVERTWPTVVHVLWGDTGTGKTATAMKEGARPVSVDKSGFFHGEMSDVMLIDEFEPTMLSRSLFLQLTDRYPMVVNIKGGSRNWAPRHLYLTSNHDPNKWYADENGDQDAAVRRRLKENGSSIIHLTEPFRI